MAADNSNNQPDLESNELVAQLRQSLGLLRVAFDTTEEAMLILDDNHQVRWVNRAAAQWLGNGLALRVIGKSIQQVASFEHADQRDLPYDDPQHPLSQAKRGDGQMLLSIQPLLIDKAVLPSTAQRMVSWKPITEINEPYLLIVFRDLDPLEKALQQQRSFINKLAHELRTPLAIISGNLKRLSRASSFNEALARPLEDVRNETRRMVSLVDKLVVLSELDTDQFTWSFERHPLRVFVEQWLRSLDITRRNSVRVSISEQCLSREIELDHIAFNKVMNQLLDNSLRFTKNDHDFVLHGTTGEDFIELIVSDGGSTFTSELSTDYLFDRFVKLEENRNPNRGEGSGLGLSVVQALVEGMNGTIAANTNINQENETNHGINFSIMFPTPLNL